MKKTILIFVLLLSTSILPTNTKPDQMNIFLKEDFNSLDLWEPLHFPKIKEHSIYTVVADQSGGKILKTEANASASGIVFKKTFEVTRYPIIRWRWKVANILKKGNAKEKSGDDYPIRIYVIFKYDPDRASFFDKAIYNAAKLIYGEYPPHSSLNYIWANKIFRERIITNTYTDKAEMILLQMGNDKIGKWQEEEVDILKDYKEAFGESPPVTASLAIMSDTDNTGEKAIAYVDYIIVSGRTP